VDRLAVEIALRDVAWAVDVGFQRNQFPVRVPKALLGQLAFRHAVRAPHLMAVHRAHLAGQPGDGRDHEIAAGVDVKHVAHVARRIADAVLRAKPRRLL